MYLANGNQILVETEDGLAEVFLTVHPTHSTFTVEKLAVLIADILNKVD